MLMMTNSPIPLWTMFLGLGLCAACTTLPTDTDPNRSACANADWFEAGRSDGHLGLPLSRLEVFHTRCDSSKYPVDVDLYTNGRDAGLIEFCSATGGLEAGRSATPYEKLCPEHLETVFLENYELGRRIRELESESSELGSRIETLVSLSSKTATGGSVHAQIDQLRARQAKINKEISAIEGNSSQL